MINMKSPELWDIKETAFYNRVNVITFKHIYSGEDDFEYDTNKLIRTIFSAINEYCDSNTTTTNINIQINNFVI
jgi:hypothetical protein